MQLYFNLSLFNVLIIRHKLGCFGGKGILFSLMKNTTAALLSLGLLSIALNLDVTKLQTYFLIASSFMTYFIISRYIFITEESLILWTNIYKLFPKGKILQFNFLIFL